MTLTFIYMDAFVKRANKILNEQDYLEFEHTLLLKADAGNVVKNAGGLRKVRVANALGGKSGGFRVLYLLRSPIVFVIYVYAKSERSDLTPAEYKELAKIAKGLK
jgi:hypothetical protein